MTLKIGNKGFTLVELMVVVSIVSLATAMIYQSNLIALHTYGQYLHRLSLQDFAEEKIWEAKEKILASEKAPEPGETSGVFSDDNKNYEWQLKVESMLELNNPKLPDKLSFFMIRLTLRWQEGGRPMTVSRLAYVQKKVKKTA